MNKLYMALLAACLLTVVNIYSQNIGVGTSSPLEKLHIDSGHIKIGRAVLTAGQTNLLKFGDGEFCTLGEALSDDQMVFTASHFLFRFNGGFGGRVGIGTTGVPAAQLEVNGTVKITDGSQAAGKVLTSDAAGMANWQTPVQTNTGFKAIITAGAQNITSGSDVTLIFTGEEYDDASNFFSTAYFVPAAGLYHFDIMVNWDVVPVAFATQYNLTLSVSGTDVHINVMQLPANAADLRTQTISTDLKLAAGQQVSVKAGHNSGILQPVRGSSGAGRFTWFSGHRVY